jgi:4-amino-4-deoxy-L-arabinose transferase-like glycosyltransferase
MAEINYSRKQLWLFLLIVIALIFFTNLDAIYVNIMEARNFITAREMVNQNHWLLTTLNDHARYEKPPLPPWLTAISGSLFGFKSLIAMRLPAALSSLLLISVFFKWLPKLDISLKQAFIASLILASSFFIIFSGRNGQWDIFAHAFMVVSLYFYWRFFRENKAIYKNAILAGVFFGLSFLSKGPVSPYALFLPFLISFGMVYKFKPLFPAQKNFKIRSLPFIISIGIGLAVGTWWFLYVRFADPEAFLRITGEETANWHSYEVKPFWYYWSFFIQSGIWTIPSFVALLYPYLKNCVSNKKAYLFSVLWTLVSVVLLSVIPEKKSRYLLPVLIPMALNTSFYIEYLFRKFKTLKIKETAVVYVHQSIIALVGIGFPIAGYFVLDIEGVYWVYYILSSIALFGIGVCMVFGMIKKRFPLMFYLTIAFICAVMSLGFPLVNSLLENPRYQPVSELHRNAEKNNLPVFYYGYMTPEMVWDYGTVVPELKSPKDIPDAKLFGVLINKNDLQDYIDNLPENIDVKGQKRYDINAVNPKKSGYKSRLIQQFLLLENVEGR